MYRIPVALAALLAALMPIIVYAQDVVIGDGTENAAESALPRDSPIEVWHGLVALIIPFVVAFIIQRGWSYQKQKTTLVVITVITAVVGEYIQGGFDNVFSTDPILTFLKVVTLSQISYKTLYQAVPLPQKVEELTGGDPASTQPPQAGV